MPEYIDIHTSKQFDARPRDSYLRILDHICIRDKSIKPEDIATWDLSQKSDFSMLFFECQNPSMMAGIVYWDISACRNMMCIFAESINIPEGISRWNTAACRNMAGVFWKCECKIPAGIANWDTGACRDMSNMFDTSEANIMPISVPPGIANWDTAACRDFKLMFRICYTLNVPLAFNMKNVEYERYMFGGCFSLKI